MKIKKTRFFLDVYGKGVRYVNSLELSRRAFNDQLFSLNEGFGFAYSTHQTANESVVCTFHNYINDGVVTALLQVDCKPGYIFKDGVICQEV